MAFSNFPVSLDNFINPLSPPNFVWRDGSIRDGITGSASIIVPANPLLAHTYQTSLQNEAVAALQVKVGIDGSDDTASLDYLLKNVSSVDPGHLHSAAAISGFDEAAQDAVGNIFIDSAEINFTYNDATPSITASIVAGSIDETKLDASVNASLDLADTAVQPAALTNYYTKAEIDAFLAQLVGGTPL